MSSLRIKLLMVSLVILLSACSRDDKKPEVSSEQKPPVINHQIATAEISNANNFALQQEPIYFSFYDLGIDGKNDEVKNLSVSSGQQVYPSQIIDSDGNGERDGLLLAADFNPAEKKLFVISSDPAIQKPVVRKQTQAEISIKEGGEWKGKEYVGGTFKNVDKVTPPPQYTDHSFWIRYEGPGIESDKVAYRVYLDWRNGFDIFGKKTSDMVLQNVGLDGYDSYHENSDWGVDVLKVGKSLGMGGYGFWNGKSVDLVSQVDEREAVITNNGDIYSAFSINYKGWQVDQQKLDLHAHLSMTAASRLVKVQLTASKELPNLAIGLVKHPNVEFIQGPQEISGYAWTYVASWGKQSLSGVDDHLGMAIIFRRDDRAQQTQDDNSYVSVMKDKGGELEYYFVAAWEHELNGIKTRDQFVSYLDQEIQRLTKTPRVRFESTLSQNAKADNLTADEVLKWTKGLADSELDKKIMNYAYGGWDHHRRRPAEFEYDVTGLQIHALQELHSISPDQKYQDALEVPASFVADDASIYTYEPELFSIDLINPGRMFILLDQQTKIEKYRKAADYLRSRLALHPRTSNGAFWHRVTYPNQLWLDGVYMGMPFLAQYAAAYETGEQQHKSFKEVVHEFEITREQLRDPQTGLYYHAWDESKQAIWADKQTGRAPQFWSRGMGWLGMAMVDVLDYLPESETDMRKTLIDMLNEFAGDIVKYQDAETGTWWQIPNKPGEIANYRESSASAMFTYMLAKGVNKGYLPDSYREPALKAYQGMLKEFITLHADGKVSLNDQCLVAGLGFGRDGSYDYYMTERIVSNDAKGVGPFIFAGVEVYKLLKK